MPTTPTPTTASPAPAAPAPVKASDAVAKPATPAHGAPVKVKPPAAPKPAKPPVPARSALVKPPAVVDATTHLRAQRARALGDAPATATDAVAAAALAPDGAAAAAPAAPAAGTPAAPRVRRGNRPGRVARSASVVFVSGDKAQTPLTKTSTVKQGDQVAMLHPSGRVTQFTVGKTVKTALADRKALLAQHKAGPPPVGA